MDSVRSGPYGQIFRPDNFVFGQVRDSLASSYSMEVAALQARLSAACPEVVCALGLHELVGSVTWLVSKTAFKPHTLCTSADSTTGLMFQSSTAPDLKKQVL